MSSSTPARGADLDSTSHMLLSHPKDAMNGLLISMRTRDHLLQTRDMLITDNWDLFFTVDRRNWCFFFFYSNSHPLRMLYTCLHAAMAGLPY